MVDSLSLEEFNKRIKENKETIIVDFWASWCGPCKALAPIFQDLSQDEDFKGKLAFAKISTEEHPSAASENGVSGIPCLILFKDGKEVDRIVGFKPKSQLKDAILAIL